MSQGSSTNWNNYRPPGMKNVDDMSRFDGMVTTFVKNTSLRFLQTVYGERPLGQHCFHYDEDPEKSEIKIADRHAFQLVTDDKRPAIIAIRGPLSYSKIGFNDGLQTLGRLDSRQERTTLINGGVSFACISRVGLEAELLASEVFNLFKFFKGTLQKYGFFTVSSMSVGPEQIIEAAGEPKLFLVSVQMQCQVQDKWIIEPKSAADLRNAVIEGLVRTPDGEEETIFKTVIDSEEGGSQ